MNGAPRETVFRDTKAGHGAFPGSDRRISGWPQYAIAAGLIVLIIVMRWGFLGIPNFQPVVAAALLAGFLFANRYLAVAVPLLALVISDISLGSYALPLVVSVYACLLLPVWFGGALRRIPAGRPWRFLGGWFGSVIGSSVLFYLVTNWAVWQFSPMYPGTVAGLVQCYVNAIPFFRWTIAGDLFFAGLLFGSVGLAQLYISYWSSYRKTQSVAGSA